MAGEHSGQRVRTVDRSETGARCFADRYHTSRSLWERATTNGHVVQRQLQDGLESLLLFATGHDTNRSNPGLTSRSKLRQIDLHWPDLRHEGACRLLADGVDTRIIQMMLGHAIVQQTPRYLNVTDEELRKGLEVSWKRRTLKAVEGGLTA
jgi:integrase